MARPRKEIDERKVEQLASIGCSEKEIGQLLGCSDDLLERRFAGPLKRGRARRNQNLRKLQYEAAKRGNVTMQIWLGKQWLGQKDSPEAEDKPDVLGEVIGEWLLSQPIDFADLQRRGVLSKEGAWYRVLDLWGLPENAAKKINARSMTRTAFEPSSLPPLRSNKSQSASKRWLWRKG